MISYWFVSSFSISYGCLSNCRRLRSSTVDQLLVCFYSFSNIYDLSVQLQLSMIYPICELIKSEIKGMKSIINN